METLVHNESGRIFRKVSVVGKMITITPELASYLEKGFIFTREWGEDGITIISRDELENEFKEVDDDRN